MAWAKTKTAIETGFVALLLIGPAITILELLLPADRVNMLIIIG
jgi:hypothetical protein